MECSRIRIILLENADTDLPVEIREKVEAHLAGCPSCARQFEFLLEQSNALKSLPRLEAPKTLVHAVRRKLDRPGSLKRFLLGLYGIFEGGSRLRLAGTAVAAILVVAIFQFGLRESGTRNAKMPVPPPKADASTPSAARTESAEQEAGSEEQAARSRELGANAPALGVPALLAPRSEPAKPAITEEFGPVPDGSKKDGLSIGGAASSGDFREHSLSRKAMDVPSRVEITLTVPVFSSSKETSSKAAAPASAKRETGERYTAFAPPPKEAREFGSNAHRPGADEADPSDSIRSSSTFSRIRLLILRANGKLLDTDAAQNRNSSVSLLCEIPAENYPALRRDLFLLGATGGADIELDPPPRTILLRIEMVPRK